MRSKDPWDCQVLAKNLEHPLHVVDVGAAGGIDPVWRPAIRAGYGLAWGFEPLPENFRKLKATEKIKYFPFAISDSVGVASFYGLNTVGSLVRRTEREKRFSEEYQQLEVKTETLAHLRADGVLPPIDVLKIDVESAEAAVLRGAGVCLDDVLYLKAEFSFDRSSGNAFHAIDAIADQHGLKLFEFAVNYTGYEALSGGDVLYMRNIKSLLAERRDKGERKIRVAKLIAISLINNYRQYAYVCARSAIDEGLFAPEEAAELVQFITKPFFVPILVGGFPGKGVANRLAFNLSQLFAGAGLSKSFARDNRLHKSPRLWRHSAFLSRLFNRKIREFWESVYTNSKWN